MGLRTRQIEPLRGPIVTNSYDLRYPTKFILNERVAGARPS
jgi:hypothetical protein